MPFFISNQIKEGGCENKMTSEYDSIAKEYAKADQRLLRRFCYAPHFKTYIGQLNGERALDIGCGNGASTRLIKSLGAGEVIGTDISSAQIDLARSKQSEGITYYQRDARQSHSDFGSFNLVTAMLMLHTSETLADLQSMVKTASDVLLPGGRFHAIVANFKTDKKTQEHYGCRYTFVEGIPPREGALIDVELSDLEGNKLCNLKDHFWPRQTYEKVFHENGLSFESLPGIVSEEGIKAYGEEFWKEYLKNPLYLMIKGVKTK